MTMTMTVPATTARIETHPRIEPGGPVNPRRVSRAPISHLPTPHCRVGRPRDQKYDQCRDATTDQEDDQQQYNEENRHSEMV
ncbi:hypothetical protein [Nocardia vinacea]|uniref:hypothetical protein n=1 Tax=Nocardia vinacea TaxID=96468 RepID=UPI00146DC9D6|nr:hypothetical protein [Nocardia vinacea]